MKLIFAIINKIDDRPVIDALLTQQYRVTRIASTGGFLRKGNVTLLIGVQDDQVDAVMELLRQVCSPPEPGQHRATIFVVDSPFYEQI